MKLRNGRSINRRVKDSSGPNGYVFMLIDCYWPVVYLVRGESMEDAYDWFLCDPRIEAELTPDEIDLTWARDEAAKALSAMGRPVTDEACEEWLLDGWFTFNDNGTMIWSDVDIQQYSLAYWIDPNC